MTPWPLFNEYMLILDSIWEFIEGLIPSVRDPNRTYERKPGGGRKRTDNRILFNTILYALLTSGQWNSIFPDQYGYLCRGKTAHKWFMIWGKNNFFEKVFKLILKLYEIHCGLDIKWVSIDGTLYKAPLATEVVGKNPTDRGKNGTKRSLCVDKNGIILSMVHDGANVHDCKLLEPTLSLLKDIIPEGTEVHVCLDAGYTGYEELVKSFGFIPHIRPRGEEKKLKEKNPNFEPKRWVVEVAHSHMNQFRRLKIRYEKLGDSHEELSYLAAAIMTIRTIFRSELGEDSIWYNKNATRKGKPKRNRPIDFEKYTSLGKELLEESRKNNIIDNSKNAA